MEPTGLANDPMAPGEAQNGVPALPGTTVALPESQQYHHHHDQAMTTAVEARDIGETMAEQLVHPPPPPVMQNVTLQEAATMLTTAAITNNGNNKRPLPPAAPEQQLQPFGFANVGGAPSPSLQSPSSPRTKRRRLRRSYYTEPTEPLPQGLPYNPEEFPQLAIDANTDHSSFLHAFRQPLFTKDPSPPLAIAYSHHHAAVEERKRIRQKKKATLRELQDLREEFFAKKRDLLELNTQLRSSTQKVGGWTRKVFDLELTEPCQFNDKLHRLRDYHAQHGQVPDYSKKKAKAGSSSEEEKALAAFVCGLRNKVKKKHKNIMNYPHRISAMEELGVHWESESDARFDIMFAKLLEYKKEHGTFRMPSREICTESGDEELLALHNWVFSQIGMYRYHLKTKKVEDVQRFLDVGFSFEKWYATNGHVYERNIPPFDAICRRYVANGGEMDPEDVEILRVASEKAKNPGGKRKKKYKKRKKKKGDDGEGDVEGNVGEGKEVPVASEEGEGTAAVTDTGGVDSAAVAGSSATTTDEEAGVKTNEDKTDANLGVTENVPGTKIEGQEQKNGGLVVTESAATATAPMEGVEADVQAVTGATIKIAVDVNEAIAADAARDSTNGAPTLQETLAPATGVIHATPQQQQQQQEDTVMEPAKVEETAGVESVAATVEPVPMQEAVAQGNDEFTVDI